MSRALRAAPDRAVGIGAIVVAALGPFIFSSYFANQILTQAFWLGIVAASLIFLSAYGGMVSLAQISLFGIAGFAMGNIASTGGSKGLNLAWNPWWGVVIGIAIATFVGLLFGVVSARSTGIYFLMITLTFSVIVFYFFGQVTTLSGFGGINNIAVPWIAGSNRKLYYTALVVALVVYALIRYILRTPFGLSLQGVRDDPIRMSSLGYDIALHRTIAFGFAAFIAALAGILSTWWNAHIDPSSIDLFATLDVLVVAVIGGLYRIEGAWIGALAFAIIDNYVVEIDWIGARFHTVIGLVFLAIVVVSPGGLLGIWHFARNRLLRRSGARVEGTETTPSPGGAGQARGPA